jgi:hypothetical protein
MVQKYYNFKETVEGKHNLLTLSEISEFKTNPNKDYYMSIYSYNEEHKKQFDETGSIRGIKDVTTDTLVWDFDDKLNPENARLDTIELANRLVELGVDPDQIGCFMSGHKGFHVILPIDKEINPTQFKKVTADIAKDLKTLDLRVSDPARVLRLEHTKHPTSGLYKIPLHIAEVDELTIDQIKSMAINPREDFKFNGSSVSLPAHLFTIKEKPKKPMINSAEFDYSKPIIGWKPYKYALLQGWFEEGERHQALMVIAATCRGLGHDKTLAYHNCKSAIEKQAKRTGVEKFDTTELFTNILEKSVYSDNWEGGQFSPENNPWLKSYCIRMGLDQTDKEDKVVQLNDVEPGFAHYVKHIEENTILTGIPELDLAMPLTTGMNLGIIGAASSGKTALALSILKNTSDAGVVSVFASLDMHRNRLFEKLLYKVSGLKRDALYEKIKTGQAQDIMDKVKADYKNVFFYDRSRPTVQDIRQYVLRVEEQTGKKVKLVMLDYFERVNSERSDDTAASKDISGQLQDLVNDFDICMATLVQPNKFSLSGGPDSPILNYTAIKGSSFLYQSFRSIISIWRPFFNPEWAQYDKFMQMAILKNDLGELDMFNFGWDGKRGEIWGLTEEGEDELEKLMKEKTAEKNKANGDDDGWR